MRPIDDILDNEKIWDPQMMMDGLGGTFAMNCAFVKLPDCGRCSVVWSEDEGGMEHVSVSPLRQFRIPTWEDMAALKDIFFADEEEVYQIHPKKSQYVNLKENCLHLWRPANGRTIDELAEEKNGKVGD